MIAIPISIAIPIPMPNGDWDLTVPSGARLFFGRHFARRRSGVFHCGNIFCHDAAKMVDDMTVLAQNKKAFHDYHIDQTLEAGIVLSGPEVKSLRAGKANLRDGYAQLKNGEVFLYNVHISPYAWTTHLAQDPLRVRKLLLHRQEIRKLIGKLHEKGIALIPLKIYFIANGKAKVELALVKHKTQGDKRDSIAERDAEREMARTVRRGREDSD